MRSTSSAMDDLDRLLLKISATLATLALIFLVIALTISPGAISAALGCGIPALYCVALVCYGYFLDRRVP